MTIDEDLIRRFNAKWELDPNTGCHIWTGAHLPKGYGIIKRPRERRQYYAHRLSYLIHKGGIPKRRQVLHRCDNPACVNPDHLFLGTSKDNLQDMKAKGRHLYGCRNSTSKLSDKEVLEIRKLYAAGVRQRQLAKVYGVSQGNISRICRRVRWTHLQTQHED